MSESACREMSALHCVCVCVCVCACVCVRVWRGEWVGACMYMCVCLFASWMNRERIVQANYATERVCACMFVILVCVHDVCALVVVGVVSIHDM